jgi:hypothetical protein
MPFTTSQQSYYDTLFSAKSINVELPTGTTLTVNYKFGDSIDYIMSTVLQNDYTLKGSTWSLYDSSLRKIIDTSQITPSATYSLLGMLSTTLTNSTTEVELKFITEFKLYQYVCNKTYSVKYYQNLLAMLLRKSTSSSQVWIHENTFLSPQTKIGDFVLFTTSDKNVFVSFTDTATYSTLF